MALRYLPFVARTFATCQRPIASCVPRFVANARCSSTQESQSGGNFDVSFDESSGIAVLRLKKKPVNSLNLEMLTDLTIALDKLEADKRCEGLVLTSAVPKIFTAGLDIQELYKPEKARLVEFWKALQNFWMKLYVTRLATVAAINGHSPAGGCLLAMCCDYRVMSAGNYTIGLNETQLGIVAPFWFIDSMLNVIGFRETERALQLGLLYSADDALRIGLVDAVVNDSDTIETAKRELLNYQNVPSYARQLTKELMRRPTVEKLASRQEQDIENLVTFLSRDSIQRNLGRYLELLKAKSSKK